MTVPPLAPRLRGGPSLVGLMLAVSRVAAAAPPGPSDGADYRVILSPGAGRPPIEIRRRGTTYRHEILTDAGPQAVILYDRETGEAVVLDGPSVYLLELEPSEIGGFDAPAMMEGLVDGAPEWRPGATRTVAGAECTTHIGTGRAGGAALTGRFCVTPDGIVLAIDIGGPGQVGRRFEATLFERGRQPAALFARPDVDD